MKNYEKYLDDVLKAASEGGMAVDKDGNVYGCADIPCAGCIFDSRYSCNERALEWLKEEYVEPEVKVDWSKVEVDTKILVRTSEEVNWKPRHFAKYENGKVYAYADRTSSFTAYNYVFPWSFAKLYEGEQE